MPADSLSEALSALSQVLVEDSSLGDTLTRVASQRENIKLRDIAQRIVDRRPIW